MKLAVSDLGFDSIEDTGKYLVANGIEYLELVLTKNKPFSELTTHDILLYKQSIERNNLIPYSLLSIFYGLNINTIDDNNIIMTHFDKLIRYMEIMGCKLMILGSPNLRKKITGWDKRLNRVLTQVDIMLRECKKYLIIEPVSSYYGGEYFVTVSEVVKYLECNNYSNIFTMIDTHNSWLENKDPSQEYNLYKDYIKHIHVAEKGLGILSSFDHSNFSQSIRDYKYVITHEIRDKKIFRESVSIFTGIYK